MTLRCKTRVLRWSLYGFGLLALCAFGIARDPVAMQRFTLGSSLYGDLYRCAKIKRFKPSGPVFPKSFLLRPQADCVRMNSRDAEGAQTFLFGDSFSWICVGGTDLAAELERALGSDVYFVSRQVHAAYYRNPLLFFAEHPVSTNQPRTLVLEIVERNITTAFASPPELNPRAQPPVGLTFMERAAKTGFLKESDRNYEFLLKNSFLTFPLVEAWNGVMFKALGTMPREVTTYSLSPPMLFYYEETERGLITSFYARHDEELVSKIAGNIAMLAGELERRYRVRLVLVPIPNKFTVYSHLVCRDTYDEFIPRLLAAVRHHCIQSVDVLSAFRAQTNLVYLPTDTHWNERGMRIAVPLVAQSCLQNPGAAQQTPVGSSHYTTTNLNSPSWASLRAPTALDGQSGH